MRNHELEASSSPEHWRPTAGEPTASPEHPVTSSKHNSNGPSNEKLCHLRGNQSAAFGLLEMIGWSADVGKNAALGLPVRRAAFRPASSRRSVEVPVERQQEVAPLERRQ